MPNRDKVIDALNRCTLQGRHSVKMHQEACAACLYRRDRKCNFTSLMKDALELLKEQQGVPYVFNADGETACGSCGCYFDKAYSNCPKCGKKVDWNG